MKFDDRTTELIAIGASVAANCQACMEYHVANATEYGIGADELAQAVDIGRMVRRGAAAKVDKVADGLLHKDAAAADAQPKAESGAAGSCDQARGGADAQPTGASTWSPNRWMPSSPMTAGCCSGGFPFRG